MNKAPNCEDCGNWMELKAKDSKLYFQCRKCGKWTTKFGI